MNDLLNVITLQIQKIFQFFYLYVTSPPQKKSKYADISAACILCLNQ